MVVKENPDWKRQKTKKTLLFIPLLRTSEENAKSNGRHKGSCWTLIVFSSKIINLEHFAQTRKITKLFIKVQIWLVQGWGFKVQSSRLSTSNPLCICDFIDLILSSPILTLFVCHGFPIMFDLRNSRIDVFVSDTHYFLPSHSVSSSLPQKAFSLIVASNGQLFYLSWSLRKLSYVNVKESYSRKTTTVIINVTVLTKVLAFG